MDDELEYLRAWKKWATAYINAYDAECLADTGRSHNPAAWLKDNPEPQPPPMRVIVRLGTDHNPEHPIDDWESGCKLYSFGRQHRNYKAPDAFQGEDFEKKIAEGWAFWLSYHEHGSCVWSLRGEGPQCQWDSVDVAGVLILEGDNHGATIEERRKYAEATAKIYTAWCNGEVYGYNIDAPDGEGDSCWGFYDVDDMASQVRDALKDYVAKGAVISFEGDDAWLAEYHDFVGKSDEKEGHA